MISIRYGAQDSGAPSASGHIAFNCLTQVKTLYVYSEVFDLKPTSGLYSGCLKNPAHLFNFLA
jgi:hypothetical protein